MSPPGQAPGSAVERREMRERNELSRIVRGGALNLVGAVVAAAAGFGLTVIVTNGFPTEVAGTLFSLTSAFLIVLGLATLGTETGLVRFMLPLKSEGRLNAMSSTLRVALLPVFYVSLFIAVLLALFANDIVAFLGLGAGDATGALRLLAIALPFAAASQILLAYTRAFGRMRPTVLIDKILRYSAQCAGVLLAASVGAGIFGVTGAWALPLVIAAICSLISARRLAGRIQPDGVGFDFWPRPDEREAVGREFWRYSWPRAVAKVSQIAIQRADIVIIAALIGVGPAAIYTAATRFVVLGQLGTNSIQQILAPRFALMIARDEEDVLTEVFHTSTAWGMAISWPLYGAIAAAAPLYLRIFGDNYQGPEGNAVVIIMAVAIALAVAAGPLDTLLLMAGGSAQSMANAVVALVVNIGLCFVLIPSLGIIGAAAAWGTAVVVRNLLTLVQVHRSLGVLPGGAAMWIVGASAVACFSAPLTLAGRGGSPSTGATVLLLLLGSVAYALILWIARRPLHLASLKSLLPEAVRNTTS